MVNSSAICGALQALAASSSTKHWRGKKSSTPLIKPSDSATPSWQTCYRRGSNLAWLKETPSQALQQTLKDLERAYKNFFSKRADFPRFKKKGQSDSYRYPQGCKLDQSNRRIFLPKLGWMRYRKSRDVLGELNSPHA